MLCYGKSMRAFYVIHVGRVGKRAFRAMCAGRVCVKTSFRENVNEIEINVRPFRTWSKYSDVS